MKQLSSINIEIWDSEVDKKGADYEKLYIEMLAASKDKKNDKNVEIWWRLAKVTYLTSLDSLADGVVRAKTLLSYDYADKAVRVDRENFQANLWLAITTGKMSIIELDVKQRTKLN